MARWIEPFKRRGRRGPVPGTVKRYAAANRVLFDEITRLIRDGARSATAAAQQLANDGKVAGTGDPKNRIQNRLTNRLTTTRRSTAYARLRR
jgi:hypothetical protein